MQSEKEKGTIFIEMIVVTIRYSAVSKEEFARSKIVVVSDAKDEERMCLHFNSYQRRIARFTVF